MLTLVQQSKTRFFMFLEDDWILPFHQAHWQPIIGAVCCSVLQCGTVCCSVVQCVAVCCSVLQCGTVCCRVLQCVFSCL